jgi:hypothetical protein
MSSITLISLMTVFNAAVLCTTSVLQFLLLSPNETRKERGITKLKPLGHSEMQKL